MEDFHWYFFLPLYVCKEGNRSERTMADDFWTLDDVRTSVTVGGLLWKKKGGGGGTLLEKSQVPCVVETWLVVQYSIHYTVCITISPWDRGMVRKRGGEICSFCCDVKRCYLRIPYQPPRSNWNPCSKRERWRGRQAVYVSPKEIVSSGPAGPFWTESHYTTWVRIVVIFVRRKKIPPFVCRKKGEEKPSPTFCKKRKGRKMKVHLCRLQDVVRP